jgi:CRP-like cAMP-binding protein
MQAGDIFGEFVLLKGRLRTTDAVAETDCRLAVIKRDDLQKFVQSDSSAVLKLIEVLLAQLSLSNLRIEEAAALSVPTRLARIVLRLAERSTAPDKKLKVKQRELGHMVRASRETVNKHLRAWSKRKWIKHERVGIIVVDASALGTIARGEAGHRNGRMGRRSAR